MGEVASWEVNEDNTSEPLNSEAIAANAEWQKHKDGGVVNMPEPTIKIDGEVATSAEAEQMGVQFNPDFKPENPDDLQKAA